MNNYEAGGTYRGGRTLLIEDARAFHQYGLLVPPDFRLPKKWFISHGGLAVPPLPNSPEALRRVILERRDMMTAEERLRPENAADNEAAWWVRLSRERDEAVEFYDPPRPDRRWNPKVRDRWWGRTGHTVASAIAAACPHAQTGNPTPFMLMPIPAPAPPPLPTKRQRRGGCFSLCSRGGGGSSDSSGGGRRRGGGMVICDVQNRRSPPRGSLRLRRRDDVPMRQIKEKSEDVKPPVLPAGYEVPPALHDEAHDGDIPGLSFALLASVSEIERDSPGFLETVERSAQMAASASTSRAHHDGASTSRADSSSTIILLDDSDDTFDWSASSE